MNFNQLLLKLFQFIRLGQFSEVSNLNQLFLKLIRFISDT